jgi:hypothetical protein
MHAASEQRMVGMLEHVGLDPAIAEISDPDTIMEYAIETAMKAVRQRCRQCPTVNLCERWLAGNEDCDNGFCPNARVFNELKIICDDVAQL